MTEPGNLASIAPDPPMGNLASVLILFAAWRPCSSCRVVVLYVDEAAGTASPFLCGRCEERREALRRECRPPARKRRQSFAPHNTGPCCA